MKRDFGIWGALYEFVLNAMFAKTLRELREFMTRCEARWERERRVVPWSEVP